MAFQVNGQPTHSDNLPRLGASGLKISKVILGAMSYGSPDWSAWVLDEEKSLPLLEHAYKVGINTWDTVIIRTLERKLWAQADWTHSRVGRCLLEWSL